MFFSDGFDMFAYIVVKFASLEYLDGQAKTLMITGMTPSWKCYTIVNAIGSWQTENELKGLSHSQ